MFQSSLKWPAVAKQEFRNVYSGHSFNKRSISLSVQVVFCVYNRFEELRGDGGARL